MTVPVALWAMPEEPGTIPAWSWIGFAYVALMSQYLGFFAWNAGLAIGGIAHVSQVQLLQTFVTLLIASVLNREAIHPVGLARRRSGLRARRPGGAARQGAPRRRPKLPLARRFKKDINISLYVRARFGRA